ncbi:hypothetical protein [Pseudomonas sp. ACN5]|uniref:hypothetical protein n=1 Tax=Pseudomonas sp. ACN5 TaxID=1920427 RepID=UPI000BB38EBB|nr:hypothetical protein [Pseudomonas sp. ACN5]PBJ02080.1 hypothetical protein BSF40_51790 [Pseudomonas sp. ACN5]
MGDYTELKRLLSACRAENCDGPREFQKAVDALFEVCSIETIAGLVAENEALRNAASEVLDWTEANHRPPVADRFEHGRMALVRLHALADLHAALGKGGVNDR